MKIKVRCPHCNHQQITTTVRRIRCHNCNRTFEVYPLTSHGTILKPRIVKIIEGTIKELHKEAYKKIRKKLNGRDD